MEKENTPFKLKSGNVSAFKNLGSSPVKQDKAIDQLLTNKNISKVDFEKKLAKITKTVDPYPNVKSKPSMPKNFNIKGGSGSSTPGFSGTKIAKNLAKVGKVARVGSRALLGTAGAAAGLLYEFGKESIKRKKAGKSGFNISKSKKNKGFNF
tara:strand:+ start:164 stop:619 length:456 start_codon:yes stop_codon:yes gene_type:complete